MRTTFDGTCDIFLINKLVNLKQSNAIVFISTINITVLPYVHIMSLEITPYKYIVKSAVKFVL